jgi:hypothetical protein
MTAFADALDLRTAVVEYAADPNLAQIFPRLVKQVEADFNKRLRTNSMITSTTLTFVAGTAAWPSDMVELIGIYDGSGHEYIQQSLPGAKPNGYWYAINGLNIETTLIEGTLRCDYYRKILSIADEMGATNDILYDWPNLYLYAILVQVGISKRDIELVKGFATLLAAEYASISGADASFRYSRARIRVGGMTP